jgi:spore maturation protein CgeB
VRALASRGHDVLFLERDVPWYAAHRDLPAPVLLPTSGSTAASALETGCRDIRGGRPGDRRIVRARGRGGGRPRAAHGGRVTAFYDIDTPVTLAALERGVTRSTWRAADPRFDLYLSFTGGPTLDRLCTSATARGSRGRSTARSTRSCTIPIPEPGRSPEWDLGYLGTYSDDRQPALERLMLIGRARLAGGAVRRRGAAVPGGTIAGRPTSSGSSTCRPSAHRPSTRGCASR